MLNLFIYFIKGIVVNLLWLWRWRKRVWRCRKNASLVNHDHGLSKKGAHYMSKITSCTLSIWTWVQ